MIDRLEQGANAVLEAMAWCKDAWLFEIMSPACILLMDPGEAALPKAPIK